MLSEYKIQVEDNFCSRFDRQLVIDVKGSCELKLPKVDSRSDDAKRLALDLIWAAQQIINHHELYTKKEDSSD